MKTTEERLAKLQAKRAQLDAQIQAVTAKKAKRERTEDTRRKVLVGAAVLDAIQKGTWKQDDLNELLSKFLTRPNDKALFGL